MSLSTHVLDAARGRPAAGVAVRAYIGTGCVADGVPDDPGRWRPDATTFPAGAHRLDFDTGAYFAATGQRGFYPQVSVTFEVTEAAEHHHIALLLSPFSYTTYRGS